MLRLTYRLSYDSAKVELQTLDSPHFHVERLHGEVDVKLSGRRVTHAVRVPRVHRGWVGVAEATYFVDQVVSFVALVERHEWSL